MKKLVLLSTLAAFLIGLSAFGQGYFKFTASGKSVWDGDALVPGGTAKLGNASSNSVAFLWGPTTATPLVEAILNGVPTNATSSGVAGGNYSVSAAWTAILTDPLFTLALNNSGGGLATTNAAANGGWSYAPGGTQAFQVLNSSGGVNYSLFLIAWNNDNGLYLTPSAAQSHNMYVGWSQVFTYGTVSSGTDPNLQTMVFTPFGIAGTVPEPSTLALAGLGGLSLLLFRRKKS